MDILRDLEQRILFCDGATGSILQEKGLKPGEFPEIWNITHPEIIVESAKNYLDAGADIINTNTFGANGLKFDSEGEYSLERIVRAAVAHGKEAVKTSHKKTGYVALNLGPTGKLLKPVGDLEFEKAYNLFKEVVEIGADEGADLVLIETMSDTYEVKAAVLASKEACRLPIFVTMIFDEKGKLLTGGDIPSVVALLEGLGVDALGINCGLGPYQMKELLEEILRYASIPVIVNPNAGLPKSEKGKTVYDIESDEFAKVMKEIAEMGARVVGGCCGTTPEHIRKLTDECRNVTPKPVTDKGLTMVSSYAKTAFIGKDPVLIGERINPTGKSKFKQALKDHNLEYILNEGLRQQDHGAHILDVNVGLPEINEADMIEEVVFELQSVLDLPLQIDTSNMEAMERALRIYNGKPLINSVNGKKETMEGLFPLIKKYGGVVVALLLDEDGIPETAEGRIAVAEKIYQKAAEYGIQKKDIIIDALAMTISSDSSSALVTLETLRRIRDDLHGHSILGVSNISFGLPQRELVNAAFFTMALQSGLNAAIMNPASEAMMKSYYSYRALADLDQSCQDYIEKYSGQAKAPSEAPTELTLAASIEKGLKERASAATKELLKTMNSLDIIDTELIPALDRVGKGFEKGTIFLPQLLMSAEAAKMAFEVIKGEMSKSGQVQKKKGKIVLATVKGDIHDIGKNIVKVLLENYSYDVIDLGKDVSPEKIVETVLAGEVRLVGLSALMTTTVPSMEETILQLRKVAPDTKIMVGGAVLTQEYADSIDADAYCKDAMAAVSYAEQILQS